MAILFVPAIPRGDYVFGPRLGFVELTPRPKNILCVATKGGSPPFVIPLLAPAALRGRQGAAQWESGAARKARGRTTGGGAARKVGTCTAWGERGVGGGRRAEL